MTIINLDKLVPDDKEVQIGGKVWKFPAQASVKHMLTMLKNGEKLQENSSDPKVNEEAFKSLYDIFLIRHPDLKYDDFQEMISIPIYIELINILFDVDKEASADAQKKSE